MQDGPPPLSQVSIFKALPTVKKLKRENLGFDALHEKNAVF